MSSPFLPDNESYYEFYKQQAELNGYYRWACHFIPFVTLPIYAEAFYCVIYKCKQFSPKYVRLLQVHMFIHFFGEIYWTVFLLPVIVLPGISVSVEGLLSVIQMSPDWQLFIMCGILQISSATMIHLLIFRLKFAIPPNATNQRLAKAAADFLMFFFYFTVISCTFCFTLMDEDQKVAKERMLVKFLVPPPNIWEPNYVTTDRENPNFKYFIYVTLVEILIFAFNIVTIPTVSFHYLSKNRTDKSEKLALAHKRTLQTLVFQLFIHCTFHLLPLVCFTFSAIFRTSNIGMLSGGLCIWALHGAACTLALVVGNKPFRMTAVEHLRILFCCLCCQSSGRESHENSNKRRDSTVVQKIDITN